MDTQGVLPVKYFGFASYDIDNSLATFFYNCKNDSEFQKGIVKNRSPMAKNEAPSVDLRNCTCTYLFNLMLFTFKSNSFFSSFSWNFQRLTVLVTKCRFYSIKYDTADYDYKDYVKLSDIKNSQPDGYILRILLFIQGGRDANILLTTSTQPDWNRDLVYEIGESRINFQSLFAPFDENIQNLL